MIIGKIPDSVHSKEYLKFKCDDCGVEFEKRYDTSFVYFSKHNKHRCKKCSYKNAGKNNLGRKLSEETIEKSRIKRIETNKRKRPSLTLCCKFCQTNFIVSYRDRDRIYCSRSCQSKSIVKSDSKKTSICLICKNKFKHYGERLVCGRDCNAKYMSITRIAENNPSYKENKEVKKCLNCQKEFEYNRTGLTKGVERVFCSLACSHKIDLKNNSLSKRISKYPNGWNKKLKDEIKIRDNFDCQLCGLKQTNNLIQQHHVHHIDYDKSNLDHDNLITLCQRCHNMTHHGRTFWEIIFAGLLSGSQIVKKPWGAEIHIVNHNDYCLKYLIFFKDKQFSYHYHVLKKELWHCVYGKFECVIDKDYFIFKQGDKIEIERNVKHQLQAIKNSILVEVSTRDYSEDSIRVINGIN